MKKETCDGCNGLGQPGNLSLVFSILILTVLAMLLLLLMSTFCLLYSIFACTSLLALGGYPCLYVCTQKKCLRSVASW